MFDDYNSILSIISVTAAVLAVIYASRSSGAARRSARTAELQAQTSFSESIQGRKVPLDFKINEVCYRWSDSKTAVFNIGGPSSIENSRDQEATWASLCDQGINAEIVIKGTIRNEGNRQLLLTFENLQESRRRAFNEGVFLMNGHVVRSALLEPEELATFEWVDRRSLEEWRCLYVAGIEQNLFDDPDLNPPRLSIRARITSRWEELCDYRKRFNWSWRQNVMNSTGFNIFAESRMSERLISVWSANVRKSALEAWSRDHVTSSLTWKLRSDEVAPIDDDVILYRHHFDSTLAQVSPPKRRRVPGRL